MKIFIGIIVVVVVLVILSQVMRLCFTSYLNMEKGNNAVVLSNNRQSSKKGIGYISAWNYCYFKQDYASDR